MAPCLFTFYAHIMDNRVEHPLCLLYAYCVHYPVILRDMLGIVTLKRLRSIKGTGLSKTPQVSIHFTP